MKFQSCDYSFNCIPNAHENCARVARPFLLRAGDAIHPALWEREGSGFEISALLGCAHEQKAQGGAVVRHGR